MKKENLIFTNSNFKEFVYDCFWECTNGKFELEECIIKMNWNSYKFKVIEWKISDEKIKNEIIKKLEDTMDYHKKNRF
jgi:hypothetical protein